MCRDSLPGTVIIGSQFGDEGKGKVTDFYAKEADIVVRYQGGNNAGHTLVVDGKTYKLHLLPSGVLYDRKIRIAAGVVLDPAVLEQELQQLPNASKLNLRIDPRTNIIMPWHQAQDSAVEEKGNGIGTTKRGIGPCYEDRASRLSAIRFEDLVNEERLRDKIQRIYPEKKKLLEQAIGIEFPQSQEDIVQQYNELGKKLAKYLGDVSLEICEALENENNVLFEGAQGTFLDNDFGTFPFVTSSHPISGGVAVGVGMPASKITRIIGVVKAYTTRVGEGPMPTELSGEEAEELRNKGAEFGTTTGRARRVGWLDLPLLRTSARLNGFTELAVTKLDVLCGLDKLKIAKSYRIDGKEVTQFPADLKEVERAEPVYEELEGFEFKREEIKKIHDLPPAALTYLSMMEKEIKAPVNMVSIGPDRNQTLID